MTLDEITSLRAKVFLDPAAAAFLNAGNTSGLRAYLNAVSIFVVWKIRVTWDEIMENGMDFTRVDNLTTGSKWRVWEWLFKNSNNAINPAKPNHRAGIDAAWVGTAQDLAVRAAVYVHCKRFATAAEKMLSSGLGTDAVPATMTFAGEVSDNDAARIVYKDNGTIWTAAG